MNKERELTQRARQVFGASTKHYNKDRDEQGRFKANDINKTLAVSGAISGVNKTVITVFL